jgi:hypothetical protein
MGASAPIFKGNQMAVIYMKHEFHGAKVATMEAEAVADEKNGWVRYTHDTPSEVVEEAAPKKEVKPRARKVAEPEQPAEVPNFLAPAAESAGV